MFECPSCGGNLKFDIPSQQLVCEYCHSQADPYSFENKTKDAEETTDYEVTVFTCPQCGGEIISTDQTAAAFCSFCGASTILYSRISKEKRPNYIIPFQKTKEDCKQAYSDLMKHAIFAPKELKDPQFIDGFRGIYMPYWSFYITQKGAVDLKASQTHRRGDYIITDHYSIQGDLDAYYKGLSYDASSSFSDSISEAIAPYDVKGMKAFTPSYLSGFYADTSDVDAFVYQQEAEAIAHEESIKQIQKMPVLKSYSFGAEEFSAAASDPLHTTVQTPDQSMFPVWFLSYRNGDRVAYATVNGQTGKAAVDLPIDLRKYLLGSLILAVPIFILLNLLFTVVPSTLLTITAVISLFTILISTCEICRIAKKEGGDDDRGLLSKTDPQKLQLLNAKRISKKEKTKSAAAAVSILHTVIVLMVLIPLFFQFVGLFVLSGSVFTNLLPDFMSNFHFSFLWLLILIAAFIISMIGFRKLDQVPERKGILGMITGLVGIIIGAIVTFFNPASDLFFYGGVILSLIAVFFTVKDVIGQYNLLSTRKLPQFDRQGGDDRA